ncbi:hypothetical protein HDU67_004953 [Dinochytrium kinnereticum]|nr:hypothetical protein HDU67_004953 [Dinochytrium kinnereticum]
MSWYVHGLALGASIAVLHFVAKEVVGVVGMVAILLGVGSVLIGVTVFMVGCNLGDLLTNLSLANLNYTSLSVRTSFASPMLNLLFGIGLSTVWVISLYGGTPLPKLLKSDDDDDDDEVAIFTSTSVLIILYGLLASVVFSAVYVPWKGFRAGRTYGAILVGWWGLIMGAAVIIEWGWGDGMGPSTLLG